MRFLISILLFLIAPLSLIVGQESLIRAFKSEQSPIIDVNLNESVWNTAIPFCGFRMVEPTSGSDPTEKTEIRVIYDPKGIYFGIKIDFIRI